MSGKAYTLTENALTKLRGLDRAVKALQGTKDGVPQRRYPRGGGGGSGGTLIRTVQINSVVEAASDLVLGPHLEATEWRPSYPGSPTQDLEFIYDNQVPPPSVYNIVQDFITKGETVRAAFLAVFVANGLPNPGGKLTVISGAYPTWRVADENDPANEYTIKYVGVNLEIYTDGDPTTAVAWSTYGAPFTVYPEPDVMIAIDGGAALSDFHTASDFILAVQSGTGWYAAQTGDGGGGTVAAPYRVAEEFNDYLRVHGYNITTGEVQAPSVYVAKPWELRHIVSHYPQLTQDATGLVTLDPNRVQIKGTDFLSAIWRITQDYAIDAGPDGYGVLIWATNVGDTGVVWERDQVTGTLVSSGVSDGVVTADDTHTVVVGDTVGITWDPDGSRTGMVVTAVNGLAITVTGGSGDDFPGGSTSVVLTPVNKIALLDVTGGRVWAVEQG